MVRVTINTFGYGHGTPEEPSDITLDIRRHVLATHQIPDAEQRTGLDPDIANTVLSAAGVARLVDNTALLAIGLLEDVADARARLVKIAVGDARGVHWSVGIAEEIARVLRQNHVETEVVHREIQVPSTGA
ncbi:RNase adapter RapZ [Streptomyces sp. NPDC021356]|uniref:RapZ C-terminal domain-containing protein n=1 Tax=Streptomyces sp. NPDC021356 TaxID=3154900 RepID=UPI0033FAA2B0